MMLWNKMSSVYFLGAFLATIVPYFVSATFQALGEKGPLIVPLGADAILPCWLSPVNELTEVRWFRIRSKDVALINLFRDGKDQQTCYIPRYVGRTELITKDIASGKVALRIRSVSVADEGLYRCYLETLDYFDHAPDFELKVTAVGSDPRIYTVNLKDGRVKLVCRSHGWYPEPTLLTRDTEGRTVELNSAKKIQKENGLYDVEYSRFIADNSDRTFICILRPAFPGQERESSLYVADAVFKKPRSTHWWGDMGVVITVFLIAASVSAVVILYPCNCRGGKTPESPSGPITETLHLEVTPEDVSLESALPGSEDPRL